jgi:hypothetical protein
MSAFWFGNSGDLPNHVVSTRVKVPSPLHSTATNFPKWFRCQEEAKVFPVECVARMPHGIRLKDYNKTEKFAASRCLQDCEIPTVCLSLAYAIDESGPSDENISEEEVGHHRREILRR